VAGQHEETPPQSPQPRRVALRDFEFAEPPPRQRRPEGPDPRGQRRDPLHPPPRRTPEQGLPGLPSPSVEFQQQQVQALTPEQVRGAVPERPDTSFNPTTGYPMPAPKARPGEAFIRADRRPVRQIELGVTGTTVMGGQILQDPNVELQFPRSIAIYDKMRRTDGQVKAAILAVILPVLSLEWDVEPHHEIDEQTGVAKQPLPVDEEIAAFIRKDLIEGRVSPWKRILREILGMVWAGFWVIEPIFETREDDDLIHLRKLASRLPQSVFRWQIARDGALEAIVQRAINPATGAIEVVTINAADLLVFVNDKEGADWTGISVLRAAYKHFYHKDWLYRLGVINTERGGGFPVITLPEDGTPGDLQAAHDVGESIHIHERAYVIEPPNWKFRLETGVTRMADVMTQIVHHDQKISSTILAQFMDMGSSEGGGARAMAGEFIDLFLMALEAVINNVEETVNQHLIKRWVDYNWTVVGYPKLKAQNIRGFNVRRMGAILRMLTDGQMITPDEPLETFLRKAMGLPDADPESRRGQEQMMQQMLMAQAMGQGEEDGKPGENGNQPPFGKEPGGPGGPGKFGLFGPGGPGSPFGALFKKGGGKTGAAGLAGNPQVSLQTGGLKGVGGGGTGAGGEDLTQQTQSYKLPNPKLAEPVHLGSLRIEMPVDLAAEIAQWQQRLPRAVLAPPGLERDPHVTVKTGLHTLDDAEVEQALQGFRRLRLTLGEVVVFPQPERDVVAIAVTSPDLLAVRARVSQRLAWEDPDAQGFVPHLTLASVQPGTGWQFAGDRSFAGQSHTVEEAIFAPKGNQRECVITLARPHFHTFGLAERKTDLTIRPFFYRRPLTPLERCCNFQDIDQRQKSATTKLLDRLKPIQADQIESLVRLATAKPDSGKRRLDGVTQIRVPYVGKMANAIREGLGDIFQFGRQTVRDELQRQATFRAHTLQLAEPLETDEDFQVYIGAKADVLAERWAARLKEAALTAQLKATRAGRSDDEETSTLRRTLSVAAAGLAAGLLFQGLVEAFALGRRTEATAQGAILRDTGGGGEGPGGVGGGGPGGEGRAQYSAVMDSNTCSVCSSLDGLIAPLSDPRMQVPNEGCLGEMHDRQCRCVLIYSLPGGAP
jgi:2'-5' RNA ligase